VCNWFSVLEDAPPPFWPAELPLSVQLFSVPPYTPPRTSKPSCRYDTVGDHHQFVDSHHNPPPLDSGVSN